MNTFELKCFTADARQNNFTIYRNDISSTILSSEYNCNNNIVESVLKFLFYSVLFVFAVRYTLYCHYSWTIEKLSQIDEQRAFTLIMLIIFNYYNMISRRHCHLYNNYDISENVKRRILWRSLMNVWLQQLNACVLATIWRDVHHISDRTTNHASAIKHSPEGIIKYSTK